MVTKTSFLSFFLCPLAGSNPATGYNDGMKEKILYMTRILITGLLWSMILTSLTYSKSYVSSQIECNGNCTVKQTINNQTLEIKTNGLANIQTNLTNSTLTYKINATGSGKLETNLTGDYRLTTIVDEKTESYSGSGFFFRIFNFLKSILSFGLVKW